MVRQLPTCQAISCDPFAQIQPESNFFTVERNKMNKRYPTGIPLGTVSICVRLVYFFSGSQIWKNSALFLGLRPDMAMVRQVRTFLVFYTSIWIVAKTALVRQVPYLPTDSLRPLLQQIFKFNTEANFI